VIIAAKIPIKVKIEFRTIKTIFFGDVHN